MGEVVIVGGGHAAGQACVSLRAGGWEGGITVIGEEPLPPYQRPPLSKAYLAGELPAERLFFRPEHFYAEAGVELRLGHRAVSVSRDAKTVLDAEGAEYPYDHLIFATGTRPRPLPLTGAELRGVHSLRSAADADRLGPALTEGARLVVVGAGYIGLEVAAVARRRGVAVTVLEAGERVLSRVTGEAVSAHYEAMHRAHGVDLRTGQEVAGFEGEGGVVVGVSLASGETIPADVVVLGIGVVPNEELAAAAGLETAGGIVVDEHCATADPAVFAIGDCTSHPSVYGRRVRLESVHNALEQAKTAAASICGAPKPYAQVPWFWSDQYDVKLQTVGLMQGHTEAVVRGEPAAGAFAVFYLAGDELLAVDAVNEPVAFMAAKKLVARRFDAAQLGDPGTSLRDLAMAR